MGGPTQYCEVCKRRLWDGGNALSRQQCARNLGDEYAYVCELLGTVAYAAGVAPRVAVSQLDIERWMVHLLTRVKIEARVIPNIDPLIPPVVGIFDVPVKYVSVIDAMHDALSRLAAGEALPEIAQEPLPLPRAAKKKR